MSEDDIFTPTFSSGVLTLGHDYMQGHVGAVTARSDVYQCNFSENSGGVVEETTKIEWRNHTGTLITSPDTDMRASVVRSYTGGINANGVDTDLVPFHAIWFACFTVPEAA